MIVPKSSPEKSRVHCVHSFMLIGKQTEMEPEMRLSCTTVLSPPCITRCPTYWHKLQPRYRFWWGFSRNTVLLSGGPMACDTSTMLAQDIVLGTI